MCNIRHGENTQYMSYLLVFIFTNVFREGVNGKIIRTPESEMREEMEIKTP